MEKPVHNDLYFQLQQNFSAIGAKWIEIWNFLPDDSAIIYHRKVAQSLQSQLDRGLQLDHLRVYCSMLAAYIPVLPATFS